MKIFELNESEIARLAEAAGEAHREGARFRIADDGGIKWKVGEGMWTAGTETPAGMPAR